MRLPPIPVGLAAATLLLCGCSLAEEKPREIPPPRTPTDVREAHRVRIAYRVYRRDRGLVRSDIRSCVSVPPVGLRSICKQEATPLIAQQATHLRQNLDRLDRRVGPRCAAALREVEAKPVPRAGPALSAAARACTAEYRKAVR